MNAKKAKLLRRLIKQAAVDEKGQPLDDSSYVENTRNRKTVNVEKVSGDGKSTYVDKEVISAGTIKLESRTRKGLYRKMKKAFEGKSV